MKTAIRQHRSVVVGYSTRGQSGTLGFVWLGAAILAVIQMLFRPSSIQSIVLAAAALIIVPLAFDVIHIATGRPIIWQPRRWLTCVAASLVAIAIALNPGWQAALLAGPWTLLTLSCAAINCLTAKRWCGRDVHLLFAIASLLFLAVGGCWMFISCAGVDPFDFGEPIVRLTAVHFHYAGFALTAIAARLAQWFARPAVNGVLLAVVCGIPLVAVGIALRSPAWELAATVLLGSAAIGLALLQFIAAVQSKVPQAVTLLGVSSISLVTAMALAFQYAYGRFNGESGLEIPLMIATHGLLNAVGFALIGLIGWRYVDARR
jgi:hypothetical protein